MSDDSKNDKNGNALNDGLVVPQISFRKIKRKTLGEILVENDAVTEDQIAEALDLQQEEAEQKLGEILVDKDYVSQEDMLKALAYP